MYHCDVSKLRKSLYVLLAAIIALEIGVITVLFSGLTGGLYHSAAVFPSTLSVLTNEKRQEAGLASLSPNPLLDMAAELKARDMAEKGYFAHTSPEGIKPWHWLDQVGYSYEYAGENLAVNFYNSEEVTRAWMDSPTHRANIEKPVFTEIGTGMATGTYEGIDTVFVVQMYAKPASSGFFSTLARSGAIVREFDPLTETFTQETEAEIAEDVHVLGIVSPTSAASPAGMIDSEWLSSKRLFDVGLMTIVTLITFAVIFAIAVNVGKKHSDFVTNGMIIIALALGAYIFNSYIERKTPSISTASIFMAVEGEGAITEIQ